MMKSKDTQDTHGLSSEEWVRQGKNLLFLFIIVINGMTKKVAKDSSNKPISQLNYQGLVNFPFLVTLTCLVPYSPEQGN